MSRPGGICTISGPRVGLAKAAVDVHKFRRLVSWWRAACGTGTAGSAQALGSCSCPRETGPGSPSV
eukprot:4558780-Pyramimonas_sp.AAC.1